MRATAMLIYELSLHIKAGMISRRSPIIHPLMLTLTYIDVVSDGTIVKAIIALDNYHKRRNICE
jgi:hypothetical protein